MSSAIRAAKAGDEVAMSELDARAVAFPWNPNQYAESICNHSCWLLEEDGHIVGLLVFSRIADEVELLNIVVNPACQGRGFGRQLLTFLLEQNRGKASHIFLEVRESNEAAIALYNRCGFDLCGRRKRYYPAKEGREDALIMNYEYDKAEQ